jgi:hypothetical protein
LVLRGESGLGGDLREKPILLYKILHQRDGIAEPLQGNLVVTLLDASYFVQFVSDLESPPAVFGGCPPTVEREAAAMCPLVCRRASKNATGRPCVLASAPHCTR